MPVSRSQPPREAFPDAEIIVHAHTHKPLLELVDKTVTVMNPGGAGAPRFGLLARAGILELEPGIPPRRRIDGVRGVEDEVDKSVLRACA